RVREGASAVDSLVSAQGVDWGHGQRADRFFERKRCEREAERRLEAADAGGGGVELAELVLDGVRRVVRRYAVDGTVAQTFDAGRDIRRRAQGRIYLRVRVVGEAAGRFSRADDGFVCERQVVRRDLRCNAYPVRFR